jgi:hypothetical protein
VSQGFGIERPSAHRQTEHRAPTRYLVLIETGGSAVARLFLASREQVAEFDAGCEEIASMIQGLHSETGACGPEWDRALAGHSIEERAQAAVYTLAV